MEYKKTISLFVALLLVVILYGALGTETGKVSESNDLRSVQYSGQEDTILANNNIPQTLSQTPTTWTSAKVKNLTWLSFDGVDDYVNFTDQDGFSNSSDGLTVSIWINPASGDWAGVDGDTGYVHFAGKSNLGGGGQVEWKLRIYNSTNSANRPNRIAFYHFNITGGIGVGSYIQDTPDYGNEWMHIVGIMNGTNTVLYKNGTQVDTDLLGDIGITPENGLAPVRIGNGDSDPDGFFNGSIDELRIYNRTLTSAEITQIYLSGRTANSSLPSSSLQVWAHANENAGSIVYDISGQANNGTSLGSPTYNTDGINNTLTRNTDYNTTGTSFTISNTDYSWTEIIASYQYASSYELFGFHVTIVRLVTGFVGLAALTFAVLVLFMILRKVEYT